MTDWHKEHGYIRNHAIIAAYEMAGFLFKRNRDHPDAWLYVEAGAELNELQFLKIKWELTTE